MTHDPHERCQEVFRGAICLTKSLFKLRGGPPTSGKGEGCLCVTGRLQRTEGSDKPQTFLLFTLPQVEGIGSLKQESANFHSRPDNKYSRLWRPHRLCCNHSTLWMEHETATDKTQTKRVLIKLYRYWSLNFISFSHHGIFFFYRPF